MHRTQHLHLPPGVEPEPAGQAVGHDVDHKIGDLVGVVLGEQEEVGKAMGDRMLTGVDPVGVGHHPDRLTANATEPLGQPRPSRL